MIRFFEERALHYERYARSKAKSIDTIRRCRRKADGCVALAKRLRQHPELLRFPADDDEDEEEEAEERGGRKREVFAPSVTPEPVKGLHAVPARIL